MKNKNKPPREITYADDDQLPLSKLAFLRFPPLIIGLFLGLLLSFAVSRFEQVLSNNVEVAFFIPFIVYMAAAVGNQTQVIFIRDLSAGTAKFSVYLIKETSLGIILGLLFGAISWLAVILWFKASSLALTVSLSMFATVAIAPLNAILIAKAFQLDRRDPALGAGPIGTIIQDAVSIIFYGLIASAILLG